MPIGPTRRGCDAGCECRVLNGGRPWIAGEAQAGKLHAPAAVRNRDAIADVLARELPQQGLVLEIASGSGEHAVHFAARFPALRWQPSDPDPASRASVAAWGEGAGVPNLLPPLDLDASAADWPVDYADAVVCINMTHIAPWVATLGLLDGAARLLRNGAPLVLYGPFLKADVETAPSNLAFDAQLRRMDSRFGLRAVEDIDAEAERRGLLRTACHFMPANNLTLVYRVNRRTGDD